MFHEVVKEGFGWRQGTSLLKTWQTQYFVLEGHVLFFFKNEKEVNEKKEDTI